MVIGEMPSDEEMAKSAKEETWRGMNVSAITQEIKERLRITDEEGVVITFVEPGSPAQEAGISAGTIIQTINGKRVRNVAEYNKIIKDIPAENSVRLLIKQGENSRFIILKGGK